MQGQQTTHQKQSNEKKLVLFVQYKYRWIILLLAACAMILNGLLNNIIIPIAHKLSVIYDQSPKTVNIATIISFLIFSLINIPINYFLDKNGLRLGFLIGLSLYFVGIFFTCFVNASFALIIVGYLVFTFGQPFILNTPAKIATYWFYPKNRALATSILVGSGIIGSGLGFAIPTLTISQDSEGQIAKNEVFSLYLGYALATGIFLVINIAFLKDKPLTPPSNIIQKQQLSFKKTFLQIKQDKNLWKFFLCYWLIYGSFQTFASSANLLIKPFGVSDIDISIAAICLILCGVIGAVLSSLIIKKTKNYKLLLRFCCTGALVCIIAFAIQLLTVQSVALVIIIVAGLGLFITPIIPMCYQIGCQIAFPIGQAQVTGLLNGGSLIWAFIADSLLTLIIGFGTKTNSLIFILVLIIFIGIGNVLCFFINIDLKRTKFENRQRDTRSTKVSDSTAKHVIELSLNIPGQSSERGTNPNYESFQEEKI